MKKASLIFLLAIAVFLISGCGSSEPVPITALSEIVGTWKGASQVMAMRILPDGLVLNELTLARIDECDCEEFNFAFEGGQLIVSGHEFWCGEEDGLYEVQLLPSGNLTFILVNDECSDRIGHLLARGEENEWTRFDE